MDAHLSQRTVNVIKSIRLDADFFLHRNTYMNAIGDVCNITTDIGLFLKNMCRDLEAGRKIVIPTNSRTYAEAIELMLTDRFGSKYKAINLITQKTSTELKKTECADVNTYWQGYDILIYTPTISAGISFEEKHFDCIYAMFIDQSCPVEDCMQMLMRVRNLASKRINIHFNRVGNNLPTTTEDIRAYIQSSNEALHDTTLSKLDHTYDVNGMLKFYETPCFILYLENQRIINLSKNNLISVMLGYFKAIGAKICVMREAADDEDLDDNQEVRESFNEYVKSGKDAQYKSIAEAPNLEPEERTFFELRKQKVELGNAVPPLSTTQEFSYTKYQLQEYYGIDSRYIDAKYVKTYFRNSVRRRFREIGRIVAYGDPKESLQVIRARDMQRQEKGRQNNNVDESIYDLHLFCVTFMEKSELRKFPDTRRGTYILPHVIMGNIKGPDEYTKLVNQMKRCYINLGKVYKNDVPEIIPTGKSDIRDFITAASRIVSTFYGLAWKYDKNKDGLIAINFNAKKIFDIGKEKSVGSRLPYIKLT
jgi:hypothetical protein